MKARVFRDETFGFNLHLLVPCDEEQFQKYVKRVVDLDFSPTDWHGICFSVAEDVIIGLEKPWKGTLEQMETLSHELCHAAVHVLAFRRVKISKKTEEVLCYLQGSLLRRCLERL